MQHWLEHCSVALTKPTCTSLPTCTSYEQTSYLLNNIVWHIKKKACKKKNSKKIPLAPGYHSFEYHCYTYRITWPMAKYIWHVLWFCQNEVLFSCRQFAAYYENPQFTKCQSYHQLFIFLCRFCFSLLFSLFFVCVCFWFSFLITGVQGS